MPRMSPRLSSNLTTRAFGAVLDPPRIPSHTLNSQQAGAGSRRLYGRNLDPAVMLAFDMQVDNWASILGIEKEPSLFFRVLARSLLFLGLLATLAIIIFVISLIVLQLTGHWLLDDYPIWRF